MEAYFYRECEVWTQGDSSDSSNMNAEEKGTSERRECCVIRERE